MNSVQVEEEVSVQFDTIFYNDQINKVISHFVPKFDRILKSYVLFHFLYLVIGIAEVTLLILFFTSLVKSSLFAFSLALVFLTCFSYFMLKVYLQAKQPEQFRELLERFQKSCKNLLNFADNVPEHHLIIANACTKFATELEGREHQYYRLPSWLDAFSSSIERWSCWLHWENVLQMREFLLMSAIEEHIKLVKSEPTSLEVHGALANAYVMLSSLFVNPKKGEGERWTPPERYHEFIEKKYRRTAERAIEEFKILSDFAPDDPWVHAQLAYSYHDLGMPLEEIREYEAILALCPDDQDTLFQLGVLYFQQGYNAKGLEVYEELKRSHYRKAEKLILYYGDYHPIEWE